MTAAPDPRAFPLDHLSKSSIDTYAKCSMKWRYRYLDSIFEPPSGAMIAGSAAGAAEGQHYNAVIDSGEGLDLVQIADAFNDEWKAKLEEQGDVIVWHNDAPEDVRSTSQKAVETYHELVAPKVVPVAVERKFVLRLDDMPWTFIGYIDLDTERTVADLKLRGKRMTIDEAQADIQPDSYLAARRAEGNPAEGFDFHVMTRTKKPTAEVVETARTDDELDGFLANRVLGTAADIAFRAEHDHWQGAPPGAWWCGENSCGYWGICRFGGLARTRAAQAGRAAGRDLAPTG